MNRFNTILTKRIEELFEKKANAVERLSEYLHLGNHAIYRRLKGETPFTFEEACILASKLNISLDALAFSREEVALCTPNFYNKQHKSFSEFLKDLLRKFESIVHLEDVKMYYTSKGLPFFLYLTQPELLAFKLFVWEIGSWNSDSINGKQFEFDMLSTEDLILAKKIHKCYCCIPSYEAWNSAILDSTFEQIQYIDDIGLFKNKNVKHKLLDALNTVIDRASSMADKGQKFDINQQSSAAFHLYHVELLNSTNVTYVTSKQHSFVSWTFCDPDYLVSCDKILCDRAADWLGALIKQSSYISRDSFKARNQYFNSLKQRIKTFQTLSL
ncbi:MAG: hypothetical protein AAGG68_06910 [Bacteroidota bacterium]